MISIDFFLLLSCVSVVGACSASPGIGVAPEKKVKNTENIPIFKWEQPKGEELIKEKKREETIALLRKLIRKGDPKAMFDLSMYYIEQKKYMDDTSFKKIWKSAQKGYSLAQSALGDIYGRWSQSGNSSHKKESLYWYKLAAAQDEPNAMYNLGRIYRDGWGVKKNTEKARLWFEKSAKKGNEEAKKALLEMTKS